jgi:hypothetical protein
VNAACAGKTRAQDLRAPVVFGYSSFQTRIAASLTTAFDRTLWGGATPGGPQTLFDLAQGWFLIMFMTHW